MLRWFGRRTTGPGTLTFHNRRHETLRLWLEPWAEEIDVPAGGRVDLVVEGRAARTEAEFELTSESLAFYAPGGSRVGVLVDGNRIETASASLAVPDARGLGTRGFVHTAFDRSPETRPGGAPFRADEAADPLAEPVTEGDLRLEAMAEAHRAALKAACAEDREVWAIYATSYDPEHFDDAFDLIRSRPNWLCFSIFIGKRLVGMSCFIGIEPERGVLEIGNTYYVPDMRGTGLNERVKRLMLGRAFGCGFRRVEFRVDARNARSRSATAKIGAVREGVIRAERITWTGHVRDTVLFSILAEEWPGTEQAPLRAG